MDNGKPCFMETGKQACNSALAVAVCTNSTHKRHPTTLDYGIGLGFQKVLACDEPDRGMQTFFRSGKAGYMEDETIARLLTEKIMPFVHSAAADCALVYTKNIGIISGRFDDHAHFERKHRCGRGTSGEVWKYGDCKTNTSFVRKRLKDGKTLRHEEVESMLKMKHPNVCQVYAILCSGSTVDLLLQDAGYPLRDCLTKFLENGIIASYYWKVVEDFARQGFSALVYIHKQGFCHLDIKPENMLVHQNAGPNPVLVLADFGSCLPLGKKVTLHMQLTPEYWSPELWDQACACLLHSSVAGSAADKELREFDCDVGFDTYAMGLVVYYMGTLQHLVQELETKLTMPDSVVQVKEIDSFIKMTGRQIGDKRLAFKMILMRKYKHCIPALATQPSKWVRPEILATLIEVLKSTLEPNKEKRWTDVDAENYLTRKEQVKPTLNKPTQVVDDSDSTKEYSPDETMQELSTGANSMSESSSPHCKLASFNQKMALYRQPWDNSVRTPGSASAFSSRHVVSGIPSQNTAFLAAPDDIGVRPPPLGQTPNVMSQVLPVSVPATVTRSGQVLSKNPGHMLKLGDLDVIDLTEEQDQVDIEMATNIAVAQNLEIEDLVVDDDLCQEENLLKGKTILNGQMGQLSLAKTETAFVAQGKGLSGGLHANARAETGPMSVGPTSSTAFDPKYGEKGGGKRCPSKSVRHGGIPVKGKGSSVTKTARVKQGVGGGRGKKVLPAQAAAISVTRVPVPVAGTTRGGGRGKKLLPAEAAVIPVTRVPFLVASSTRPFCVERTLEDMAAFSANTEASVGIVGSAAAEQQQSFAGPSAWVAEITGGVTVSAAGHSDSGFSVIFPPAVATDEVTLQTPAPCADTDRVTASAVGQPDHGLSDMFPFTAAMEVSATTVQTPTQCLDMNSHGLAGVDVEELLQLILSGNFLQPAISGAAAHYMPLDRPPPQIVNNERDEDEMVVADVAVNMPKFSMLLDSD